MARHAGDGGLLEQVGAVLEVAREPFWLVCEEEGEIELGRSGWDLFLAQSPIQCETGGAESRDQQHLEKRIVAEFPLRLQFLRQEVERQLLMGLRLQRDSAHAAEQVPEGGIAREIGSQHQRVDEKANQLLGLRRLRPAMGDPITISSCPL